MRIEIIPCLQDNYSYLIIDESSHSACVVDPGESKPIISSKNLGVKNLFADLGIFLIEK